jgi:hypothetical protein
LQLRGSGRWTTTLRLTKKGRKLPFGGQTEISVPERQESATIGHSILGYISVPTGARRLDGRLAFDWVRQKKGGLLKPPPLNERSVVSIYKQTLKQRTTGSRMMLQWNFLLYLNHHRFADFPDLKNKEFEVIGAA